MDAPETVYTGTRPGVVTFMLPHDRGPKERRTIANGQELAQRKRGETRLKEGGKSLVERAQKVILIGYFLALSIFARPTKNWTPTLPGLEPQVALAPHLGQ